jgi:cell division protein FtsQ
MWPLTARRAAPPQPRDPAPSRIAYRLNRLWLSPLFRRLVTRMLPVAAIVGGLTAWAMQPQQQDTFAGWAAQVRASVEARPEFQIREMAVTGASPVLADAIRDRLALEFPISWFDVDPQAIHVSVARLDAVAEVEVTLELGGALTVAVRERQPAVIWRRSGALELLDGEGQRVAYIDSRGGRPDLPLVTGGRANAAIPEALALVAATAPIADRVRGLTRRGARRWDIVLDRDQVIRLPAEDPLPALERVLAMDQALDLLNRDVPVIDLRNPKKPTIRLGTDAMDYLRLTRAFEQGLTSQ